ncbi:MAG: aminotransferase class III-fold pyridoxal phosphate-dependent enzyme, partial [Acidobacteriota bacterium]|nr:aminotransferase class III-fold pyridoxal phosphate-dependent enzyme [Acidobacteriota bacterium]
MTTSQKTENSYRELLVEEFGVHSRRLTKLDGYDSKNFLVDAEEGQFVLKVYPKYGETANVLNAESELLNLANERDLGLFPKPIKCKGGYVTTDDEGRCVRLLEYIEASFLDSIEPSKGVMDSFGRFLASWNTAFLDTRIPDLESRRIEWHIDNYKSVKRYFEFISDPSDRKYLEYFFLQNEEALDDILPTLRKSIIHGDAHASNVLVSDGEISGLIDFGDAGYCPLINELAVALTYVLFDEVTPLEHAKEVISGYHSVLPLQEREVSLLFNLIATRACISVCLSAEAKTRRPGDRYIVKSEESAWALIKTLAASNPIFYEDQFREACGFPASSGDTIGDDLERRARHTSEALSVTFEKPIKMTGAAFQYMYDSLGNSYLDCYNNIPHVGHCHPRVVRAGRKAMARLNTNTRYLNDAYNDYADNLVSRLPNKLNKVFFVNSGSAASDLAMRLAMTHTGRRDVIVMEHGYHGNTNLGIKISHYKYGRKGGKGQSDNVVQAPIPDVYKGLHRGPDAGEKYAAEAIGFLEGIEPAAFIAEPIIGCGGQVPLADGYLKRMYPGVRERGGVCISDEVQTGFGRLGKHFWGFEMQGVIPDIVIMGKPMGNGHPLAAVVTTDEIAES